MMGAIASTAPTSFTHVHVHDEELSRSEVKRETMTQSDKDEDKHSIKDVPYKPVERGDEQADRHNALKTRTRIGTITWKRS